MSVAISLTKDAEGLMKKLADYPAEMSRALARGLDKANALVTGEMTRNRFTGKGPFPVDEGKLGVRSGRLRSSLRRSKAAINSDGSVVGSIGTNVEYMAAHEYGFEGEVNVRAHRRRVESRDRFAQRLTKAGKPSKQRGEKIASGFALVRAHRAKRKIPARAPIRRGIFDHPETYAQEITTALAKAWEQRSAA